MLYKHSTLEKEKIALNYHDIPAHDECVDVLSFNSCGQRKKGQ